jgi:hypothetical protein
MEGVAAAVCSLECHGRKSQPTRDYGQPKVFELSLVPSIDPGVTALKSDEHHI